jgi:hypothetical protein
MKKFLPLLVVLAVVTVIFGTIEITVQQSLRLSANDPQIQMAEDTASALDGGAVPQGLVPSQVNINRSPAPFVIIYDKSGRVVSGNGYLNGHVPTVPFGVLTSARGQDYSFVSWQPQSDVRIASVSVAAKNYYVLSGRSLKEVEGREQKTMLLVAFGYIVSVLIILVGYHLIPKLSAKPKKA